MGDEGNTVAMVLKKCYEIEYLLLQIKEEMKEMSAIKKSKITIE